MNDQPSVTVDRVLAGQLCTGCGLCASVSAGAIRMETQSGYNRPHQMRGVGAMTERTIASACPGAVVAEWDSSEARHPHWGPWRTVMTGYSTDPELRFRGSSGGAITALAIHALRTGQVDRVVHVLPDPSNPTGNRVVCSSDESEIAAGAGSRYAASSPLGDIDAILSDGGSIAFIGKPCDVSALKLLGLSDPRVGRHVTIMLSFFCAGVPNARAAANILAAMGLATEDVTKFRYRGEGWPGRAVAETRTGGIAHMSYARSWGEFLSPHVQFRCKICPDAVGGSADIACADAWYGNAQGYPDLEEHDGRSLILTRSERGERFLEDAVGKGVLETAPLEIGEIDKMQPSQAMRKQLVRARSAALALSGRPTPCAEGLMIDDAAGHAPFWLQLRNFLGTLRRVLWTRQ